MMFASLFSAGLYVAVRRAVEVGIGIVAVRLLAFVLSAFIARVSGAETFGEYTLFITLFIIASEIPVALDTTYIRAVPRLKHQRDTQYMLASAVASKLLYVAIVIILVMLFGGMLADAVLGKPQSVNTIKLAIICGAIYSVFTGLVAFYQQRQVYILVSFLRPVLNALILATLFLMTWWYAKPDIQLITGVYICVVVFLAVSALLWLFFRYLSIDFSRIAGDTRRFIRVGLVLIISSGVSIISNRLDVIFLSSELAYEQLALYGVGLRMSVLVAFVTGIITTILVPQASHVMGDPARLKHYLKLAALYLGFQILAAIVTIYFVDNFILILFGDAYSNAAGVTILLILQVLLTSCGLPFQALIQTGNAPQLMLGIALLRLVLSYAALAVLVPDYGLLGAGYAVVLTSLGVSVLVMVLALRQHKKSHLQQ